MALWEKGRAVYSTPLFGNTKNEITGPWSEEQLIATGVEYPKPYGGFIYPLGLDKPEIFISLSQWDPLYNVFLMKVELKLK